MFRRRLVFLAILALAVPRLVVAQELTTDAERSWRDSRDSDDVKTKLLAERWYGLVKQQEWTDATGKFKTSAKYVAHDPQLTWVKLRVIQGTGDKRVVKDVQIPIEKLSIACQARVKQIARLSDKIAEAVEAEKKKESEKESKDTPADAATAHEEGRAVAEEVKDDTSEDSATKERRPPRNRTGRSRSARQSAVSDRPPLPAMIPKLPSGRDATASAADPPVSTSPGKSTEPNRPAASADSWRTSYDAFRANIQPASPTELIGIQWGPMLELKQAFETMWSYDDVGDREAADISEKLSAVGEVNWEATLTGEIKPDEDLAGVLNLAPLPEPLEIVFVLDPERDPGAWQNLKAGDHVRFIGRFYEFHEEYGITVAIRFPESQTASEPDRVEQ